jgi:VanZ family protein
LSIREGFDPFPVLVRAAEGDDDVLTLGGDNAEDSSAAERNHRFERVAEGGIELRVHSIRRSRDPGELIGLFDRTGFRAELDWGYRHLIRPPGRRLDRTLKSQVFDASFHRLAGTTFHADNARPMLRYRWPYVLLTALYCAGIFALSAQPSLPDRAPPWLDFPGADKLGHLAVYAGLSFVVYAGLVRSNPGVGVRLRVLIPIVFTTAYGVTDEIHQRFVPNRSFDVYDLLADAVGATIAVAGTELIRLIRQGKRGTPAA